MNNGLKLTSEEIERILMGSSKKHIRPPDGLSSVPFISVPVEWDEEVVWNISYENGLKRLLGYTITKKP